MKNFNNKRYFDVSDRKPLFAEFFCTIDIEKWVGDDIINNVNFTAYLLSDLVTEVAAVLDDVKSTYIENRYLKPYIKAGTEGVGYRIKMQVETVEGSKDEFYMDFRVSSGVPVVS